MRALQIISTDAAYDLFQDSVYPGLDVPMEGASAATGSSYLFWMLDWIRSWLLELLIEVAVAFPVAVLPALIL